MSSSSSSDDLDTKTIKFDAFLSFRGRDTRKTFTDHLFYALNRKGIFTFRDEEELQRGETISNQLLKAIEDSRSSVVILSQNYASSPWCLDELVKILECKEAAKQIVLPVFYNVEPSDVRHQLGSFKDAFEKFKEKKTDPAKVKKWREALTEVANLSGWSLMNEHEAIFIEGIVNHLFTTLGHRFSGIPSKLVGIDLSLQVVEEALDIKLDGTRSVGIAGMGGIGKTTLARVVYERMLHLFNSGSFLCNVKESRLVTLQKQLLRETLNKEDLKPYTMEDGVATIRSRLQGKKVLVVLDDVDDIVQVHNLVGDLGWFGSGSRIIITSRDKHLLNKVDFTYEVKLLDSNESLLLFRQNAFENDQPASEEFESLSSKFCGYCQGLPLALEVLGSFLTGRSVAEWKSTLEQLKDTPDVKISKIPSRIKDLFSQALLYNQACFPPEKLVGTMIMSELCSLGRRRLIESTSAGSTGFQRMEDVFRKARPQIERVPTLTGGIENIRKLRLNEVGNEEIQQSAELLCDKVQLVARNLLTHTRRLNNRNYSVFV